MGQKKALNGSHLKVFLALQHSSEHDFDLIISNVFLTFVQLLQEIKKKQKRGYAFKFQIRLKAFLEKFSFENNKSIKIDAWFPSNTYTVLDSIHIRKKINTAIRDIYKRYDSVTSVAFESKDDPTQMTKIVIYNYILYYIQKTIHSELICTNVHS